MNSMWRDFVLPVDNRRSIVYNDDLEELMGATQFRRGDVGDIGARRVPVGLLKKLEKS